jgi:AAA+ ATPase superfamily predicted ATPase
VVAEGVGQASVLSLVMGSERPDEPGCARLWAGLADGQILAYNRDQDAWTSAMTTQAPVRALAWSPQAGLWAGTDGGLLRFDLESGLSRTYTRADGLIDNRIKVLLTDAEDALWIGTDLGISRHRPLSSAPQVEILTVNGRMPASGRVQVMAGEPIAINYRGSDLHSLPDQIRYRFWLQGVDETWHETADRQATYAGLQPGNFDFRVEAWTPSLNISPDASVELEVLPTLVLPLLGRVPAYQGYSIIALGALALTGIAVSMVLYARTVRRRRQAVKRRYNPYIAGEPVQAGDMFFGRDEVLSSIINTLHENSLMIHGERRIGKTSLLHQLDGKLRSIDDPAYLFVPVYIDLEGTQEEELFHVMMEEIVRVLPAYLAETPELEFAEEPAATYSDRAFSRDLRAILEALEQTTTKRIRIVLLMDEMDSINSFDPLVQQQMRRVFQRASARSLGAVVAGIEISKEWDRIESPWYNLFNELKLGPLDEEAARHLILDPVKGIYTFAPGAVELILRESQGRPHDIQQHCMEAVNLMLADGRTRVTQAHAARALERILGARASQQNGLPAGPDNPSQEPVSPG